MKLYVVPAMLLLSSVLMAFAWLGHELLTRAYRFADASLVTPFRMAFSGGYVITFRSFTIHALVDEPSVTLPSSRSLATMLSRKLLVGVSSIGLTDCDGKKGAYYSRSYTLSCS